MLAPILAALLISQSPPDARAAAQAQIAAVLDRLNAASTAADGPAYFGLFTPDARFVGTDATEHWTMSRFRAFAEPYFSQGKGWSYPATERTITVAPIDCRCVAWFEEKLINDSFGETRGSGVLRLTDDGWKIEQYVLSFAIPNETAEPVVKVVEAFRAAQPAAASEDASKVAEELIAAEQAKIDALADELSAEAPENRPSPR